jgi:hypothetical protein
MPSRLQRTSTASRSGAGVNMLDLPSIFYNANCVFYNANCVPDRPAGAELLSGRLNRRIPERLPEMGAETAIVIRPAGRQHPQIFKAES